MKKQHLDILARIASTTYQQKYIENSTSNEYVLPSDLLNDLDASLRHILLETRDPRREALLDLYVYIRQQIDKFPEDYYGSEPWNNLATAVRNYLIHTEEFDLNVWERSL